MNVQTDTKLIQGLRENNFEVVEHIYLHQLPKITQFILRNKGTKDDAKDIFQEGLVVLFNRLQEPDFQINSSFFNYFYGICKFVWLRQLKKKSRLEVTIPSEEVLPSSDHFEKELFETERRQFYKEKFLELSKDCQKVLQAFFDGSSLKKIAEKMGYTNEYAKRKKYKCKEKLAELIKRDKRFREHL